jgi:hypothetical protein
MLFVLIVAQRQVFSIVYRESIVCFRVCEGVPAPDRSVIAAVLFFVFGVSAVT